MAEWHDYPHPGRVAGTVRFLPCVSSARLGNRRSIYVHLPPSYAEDQRRYPVLYMHDGQNLFDPALSFAGEWGVDELMQALTPELEALVVGIPNAGPDRLAEYSPFPDPEHGGGRGRDYLDFIVHRVKPLVDRDFRTLPDRENTLLMGSSMGGLISLYAFFAEPAVFGAVGGMSPALWFGGGAIMDYVRAAPRPDGRIYIDIGTAEGRQAVRDVRRLARILKEKGYGPDQVRKVEAHQAPHAESAWRNRLDGALAFLLGGS